MIVYLHGFNSSPLSGKAQELMTYCSENSVLCAAPALPDRPSVACRMLEKMVGNGAPHLLVGSSMGGFYSTWLCERFPMLRAALVNPAVRLASKLADQVGKTQKNYHTEEEYLFTEDHIEDIKAMEMPSVSDPTKYLLLVQKGDEVLDYQEAVEYYAGSEQVVEDGGDHSFSGFKTHIPRILEFAPEGSLGS